MFNVCFKRRDSIRPYLRTLKSGKFLFGEELPKTRQELKTTNKLMTSITPDNRKGPNKSKSHSNSQFRGNHVHNQIKPFLMNRGGIHIPQVKPTAKAFPTQEEIHQELNNSKSKVNEFLLRWSLTSSLILELRSIPLKEDSRLPLS